VPVFVDRSHKPVLEFSDSEFTSGSVGVRQYLPGPKRGSVRFANFIAEAI